MGRSAPAPRGRKASGLPLFALFGVAGVGVGLLLDVPLGEHHERLEDEE